MIVYDKHVLGRRRKRHKKNALSAIKKAIGSKVCTVTYPELIICFIATIGK